MQGRAHGWYMKDGLFYFWEVVPDLHERVVSISSMDEEEEGKESGFSQRTKEEVCTVLLVSADVL